MYGYTPPAIVAVDPDLLADAAGFQRVAWAAVRELRQRPAWFVVKAPEALSLDDMPDIAVESCLRLPDSHLPRDLDDAVAEVLRRHLEDLGVMLDIEPVPTGPTAHSPRSAIVAGTWRDAASMARLAGAPEVVGWTLEPEWVPDEVGGVRFVPARPDRAVAPV